jgi:hypothetical protein
MSKHGGDGTRTVTITSNGIVHTVTLDGTDISHSLRGAILSIQPGEYPQLTLDPLVIHMDHATTQAHVRLDPETAALLADLGWTPPTGLQALPPQEDACRQDHPAYDADTRLVTSTGQCTRCGLLIQDDRGVWRAVAAAPAQDQPGG